MEVNTKPVPQINYAEIAYKYLYYIHLEYTLQICNKARLATIL